MYGFSGAVETRGHQVRIDVKRKPFGVARFHHLGQSIGCFFLSMRIHIVKAEIQRFMLIIRVLMHQFFHMSLMQNDKGYDSTNNRNTDARVSS